MTTTQQTVNSENQGQHKLSAVDFPTKTRPHINFFVGNIEQSVPFYKVLFNQQPTKLRADFAKFELEDPPLNFTILPHPDKVNKEGHFGIQVKSTDAVEAAFRRFRKLGVKIYTTENEVACCYAKQNKVWVVDPDGNHWEVFVVTDDDADDGCGPTCLCYDPDTGGCQW
ncbi:MAG: ArsI/CadI family heavy metal resistance metalloenzyme [Pseudomonadota bacterium]